MKKNILFYVFLLLGFSVQAQDNSLAPDQNPNYKTSLAKYTGNQEQLQSAMNTTVQNTYKAYDWYEAKQERKQQRIQFRQQRALARINSFNNFNYGYYPSYRPGMFMNPWYGGCR